MAFIFRTSDPTGAALFFARSCRLSSAAGRKPTKARWNLEVSRPPSFEASSRSASRVDSDFGRSSRSD